jgi:hypothetical protein
MEKLTEEERKEIEDNMYVKNNKIDYLFLLNNYGQCASFQSEILQSEGIVFEEHEILSSVSKRRCKWEARGGQWTGMAYGCFHIRMFLKYGGSINKFFIGLAYPLFCFDASYNFGRILGNFLVMPTNFNTLLNLRDGNSIHALQTRLFVKRMLYDEILVKNKKKPAVNWADSYVINKILGKAILRFKEGQDYLLRLSNFNPIHKTNSESESD